MAKPINKHIPRSVWEDAVRRYCDGEKAIHIAASIGVTKGTLNYHLRKAGAPKRKWVAKSLICRLCGASFSAFCCADRPVKFCSPICRGIASANRQRIDGPTISGRYRYLPIPPDHPAFSANARKERRREEHILVAEKSLGRRLKRGEVVHHINGDPLDNRPSNLLICTNDYHAALHARMSYLYQREKFAREAT